MLKNMDAPSLYSLEDQAKMLTDNFGAIVSLRSAQSILQESSYTSGKKSNSSAYFWLNNLDDLMKDFMPEDVTSMIPGGAEQSEVKACLQG